MMDQVNDLAAALPCFKPVIHVEVCQNPTSTAVRDALKPHLIQFLQRHITGATLSVDTVFKPDFGDAVLNQHVASINLWHSGDSVLVMDLGECIFEYHVYQLHDEVGQEELEEEGLAAAQHWLLPSIHFNGLWENLIYDLSIKDQLLQYANTTLLFSDKNIDSNVISWNRVVLLHGPPGTGKTSLCKALAQKLSITLSHRYTHGQLIEINSHSLFSKWFSESGKLVMKMFQKLQELIDDRDSLVFVLIDEVESLTAARKASLSGTEPSDALRVVNALLTQLDTIKNNPNVIILTTSNITGTIDLAFVDRADIKQYIGLPTQNAIYNIYLSCMKELAKAEIISPGDQLFDLKTLQLMRFKENDATRLSLKLHHISKQSEGLSGRTLRKIPFLAHALFVQAPSVSMTDYMECLRLSVQHQFKERQQLSDT